MGLLCNISIFDIPTIQSIQIARSRMMKSRIEISLLCLSKKTPHLTSRISSNDKMTGRAVVVVKWSACSPSTPAIRVQIPLKSTVFSVILCLKRTKINIKEVGPLF